MWQAEADAVGAPGEATGGRARLAEFAVKGFIVVAPFFPVCASIAP